MSSAFLLVDSSVRSPELRHEIAEVEEGALICIIEAMKMENEITAHKAGKVAELPISEGAAVASGDTLAVITSG